MPFRYVRGHQRRGKLTSPLERFTAMYLANETGCWQWQGAVVGHGYGRFYTGTGYMAAHRWAFTHFKGAVPARMHVCHRCDNPSCVNPEHLFLGTQGDNMEDMRLKGRARNGHTANR